MAEGLFGSSIRPRSTSPASLVLAPHKLVKVTPATVHSVSAHSPNLGTAGEHIKAPKAPKVSISGGRLPKGSLVGSSGDGGSHSSLGNLLGDATGGLTSFIGHLGSDVVNTAMGFPIGIAYMIQHPIAGAEGMVKATWQDWSPLFHGNVGEFAHNFYEHPLAPILDVLGFASFGAGMAARGADAAAELGMISKTGDVARWANPAKVAMADNLAKAGGDIGKAAALSAKDSRIYRLVTHDKLDTQVAHQWNRNPYVRTVEKLKQKTGNAVADTAAAKKLGIDKYVGDQGVWRRLNHLDKGRRAAAVQNKLAQQLGVLSRTGQYSASMTVAQKLALFLPHIAQTMLDNARTLNVDAAHFTAEHARALREQGLALAKDPIHAGVKEAKRPTLQHLIDVAHRAERGGLSAEQHDQLLAKMLGRSGSVFTTSDPLMAATDENGMLKVVSNTVRHRQNTELLHSLKTVRALYQQPLSVWRHMMLGLSPRYFVNNFVGNTLMLAAATDPISLWRAYRQHVAVVHGAENAAKLENAAVTDAADAVANRHLTAANQILSNPRLMGQRQWRDAATRHQRIAASVQEQAQQDVAEMNAARAFKGGNRSLRGKTAGEGLNPIDYHLSGEHHTMSMDARARIRGEAPKKSWRDYSLYAKTHELADLPGRVAAIHYSLARTPEFQQYLAHFKGKGMNTEDATYMAAQQALKSSAVRQVVALQVKHMLGQYHTFTKVEKGIKNYVVPFYSWDRAIAGHMKHLIEQEPYKVAMGAAIAQQGAAKQKEMLGEVPDFVKSMIPGGMLGGLIGNDPGRTGALNAMTLSPYGSIGDLTNMGMGIFGSGTAPVSDSLGGALNPVLQGVVQSLNNDPTNPPPSFLGMHGPAGSVLGNLTALPQVTLLQALSGNAPPNVTKSGKPTLYEHNAESALSSFLGVPIRQISVDAANRDAAQMAGKSTKKKTAYSQLHKPPGL